MILYKSSLTRLTGRPSNESGLRRLQSAIRDTAIAVVVICTIQNHALSAPLPGVFSDNFDDGSINASLWVVGGTQRGVTMPNTVYSFSHDEIIAPDGFLRTRITGPTTGNTFGAEAWVRTTYDYNDNRNYMLNFRWGATVNANHVDGYAIQITNGVIPTGGDALWWIEDSSANVNLYRTISDLSIPTSPPDNLGQSNMAPTDWSIFIDGAANTATLYNGADLSGSILNVKALPSAEQWFVRFFQMDLTSAGFPGTDNTLNLYNFSSVPSPGALSLCATIGLVLGVRRRRQLA